jgi:hypothetical protein
VTGAGGSGDVAAAVDYLAPPGQRHPAPANVGATVAADLDQLHARCLEATGPALDAGAALVAVTSAARIRYVGSGAGSSLMLDSDLVDAIVHAARAGYRLCLRNGGLDVFGVRCWLPERHDGRCETRGWWLWTLLYGYAGPVRELCSRCDPSGRHQAPADCPHR